MQAKLMKEYRDVKP
jgi:uncharacterized phage infection (PIP) family protein YhgE